MRRFLSLSLVLGCIHAVWAPPAAACSCFPIADEEASARADVVFVGSLVARTVEPSTPGQSSSADPAVHRFDVNAVYKGDVGADQEVVSAADGSSCGLELVTTGDVLVFASKSAGGYAPRPGPGQYVGDLCNGTRPLEQGGVPVSFGAPREPAAARVTSSVPDLDPPAAEVADADDNPSVNVWAVLGALGVLAVAGVVGLRRRVRPAMRERRRT